jgi:DNA-binding MarR family transcriptional regulator
MAVKSAKAKRISGVTEDHGIPTVILDRMGFLLNRAALKQREVVEEALKPYGLIGKHLGILLLIQDKGALPQMEVGKCMYIDRTTMVSMIDDLEKLGYVERKAHPTDRRAHALYLTAKGRELLPKLYQLGIKAEKKLLAPLSSKDQMELNRILRQLVLAHHVAGKKEEKA